MLEYIHVFIILSPAQLYNAETLIKSIGNENGELFILINPYQYQFNPSIWNHSFNGSYKIENIQNNFITKTRFQFYKIGLYKNLVKELFTTFSFRNKEVKIYFPHLEDMLPNYLFYKLNKDLNNKIKGYVIEDGLLNYYEYPITKNKKAILLKKILGSLLNFPFNYFRGDITGIDLENVEAQFVRAPEIAYRPDKSLQLPFEKIRYQVEENKIVILGQETYINVYGIESYKRAIKSLAQSVSEIGLPNPEIIYKPHRFGGSVNGFILDAFENFNLKFLKDDSPIEKIITQIKPKYLISFNCSALLNIRLMLDDSCLGDVKIISINYYSTSLSNLFTKAGIQVINK